MKGSEPSRLNLTRDERASSLWKRIDTYLTGRLDNLRQQNDSMMSEADRCAHIGRIAEVKQTLSLADEPIAATFPIVGRPG